jgi:hypothetical protein
LRRLQGLLPDNLDPPPSLLRQRIDEEDSFEAIGPPKVVLEPAPREYTLAPEESIIYDLKVEGFMLSNPSITNLSMPLLIYIVTPEVT